MTPGARAAPRTTPPRQVGTVLTTRRDPTSATAAAATSGTARIGPPEYTSCEPRPDGVDTAMLAAQDPTGLGSQLVHSGGPILSVAEVAEAAVSLVGSRRVIRAVPTWRGGVVRGSALAPGLMQHAAGLFAAQGRRAMGRRPAR